MFETVSVNRESRIHPEPFINSMAESEDDKIIKLKKLDFKVQIEKLNRFCYMPLI